MTLAHWDNSPSLAVQCVIPLAYRKYQRHLLGLVCLCYPRPLHPFHLLLVTHIVIFRVQYCNNSQNGFGAFVLIAAIPVTLQLAAGMAGSVHPLVQLLASAAAFLAFVLARPATIYAITQIYLGKKPKVQECFAKTSHRLGALVVTGFVHVLFYVFASAGSYGFILALMLAFVSGSGMAILCLLLPFAVCVWGFFYFALALPLLVPSIIVEQKPVFETVHRVLQLASGYRIVVFWYGFGFGLIFGVLAGILGIFGVLAGILGTVLGPFTLLGLFPLVPIAEAVFYLDARCEQENLTAETLAHEIGAYFDHHN